MTLPSRRLAPGLGITRLGSDQPEPELIELRKQNHPEDGALLVDQGEVNGVFAGALQEIHGAIKRIKDPEPLGIDVAHHGQDRCSLPGGSLQR